MPPAPSPLPSAPPSTAVDPRLARGQTWPAWRVVGLCTIGAALLSLLSFSPRFWLWPVAGLPLGEFTAIQPEVHRAYHALQQLHDPWQRVPDAVNRVIEWRLFWPVVAHTLGLPPGWYLALPAIGALLALGFGASLAWRATREIVPTVAITIFGATSSCFFVSTGWLSYFDSWLLLALLVATFARARWMLFVAAAVAPWIDERFILAGPLCLAVRSFGSDGDIAPGRSALLRDAAALVAGLAPYLAIRAGCELTGSRATSSAYWSNRPLLPAPPLVMLWGLWNGLRLGWVILVMAAMVWLRVPGRRGAVAAIGGTILLNLTVADDLSRSAAIGLPAVFAATLLLWRQQRDDARRLLPWLCAGNLMLPAQHIIAAPGSAARWHAVPILSFPAELDRVKHPPEFAHPETYTRRSLDHLQNGLPARALAAAEISVRLGPDSPKAIANHGIVLFVSGRRDEGLAALNRALTLAPQLYDARMQRAAFRQQAGDLAGALADVRAALGSMPSDWPRRREAEKFERTLATQTGL